MTDRPRAVMAMSEATIGRLLDADTHSCLRQLCDLTVWSGSFATAEERAVLADAEILVTAWGSPRIDAAVLHAAPRLRAWFHAGGTVRHQVTDACWDRDLVVVSAAEANAVPVAEFTLASILYAGKRVASLVHGVRSSRGSDPRLRLHDPSVSNRGKVIGLVGLSRIGRRVADLLRPFDVDVIASDPFAEPAGVRSLGVTLVDLDDLLARSDVVSLHAPSLPETRHLLDTRRLSVMRDGATLINTARGALVDTDALTKELVSGRLSAILDVTDPEPLPPDSRLYDLPNVQITPHVAGSTGTEVHRMGALVVAELARFLRGEPLEHQVRREDMNRVA